MLNCRIHESSGISYPDMVFFDDKQETIDKVSALGVHSILVIRGITGDNFEAGIREYSGNKTFKNKAA